VFAGLLGAAVEVAGGRDDRAITVLRRTCELADRQRMALHAAVARHRLGEMLGPREGAEVLDQARAWMTAQGVVRPERLVEVIAPWPPPRRLLT
jgi:hypothetical protein